MLIKVCQKRVLLPELLSTAVRQVLVGEDKSMIIKDGSLLASYLLKRQSPPATTADIKMFRTMDYDLLKDETLGDTILKQRWTKNLLDFNLIVYKRRHALGYLVSRLTGTYASTYRVLKEISSRVPKFKPKTILDFGSGVGATYWAVHSVWGREEKLFHSVDLSGSMLELAARLREEAGFAQDSFYDLRETKFLPGLGHYDVLVAAYSLSELPSIDMIEKTLDSLWQQTKYFLVLVEYGNAAGHSILSKFRKKILETNNEEDSHNPVFSPCPHAYTCPLISEGCYFKQRTELSFVQNRDSLYTHIRQTSHYNEKFAYLVLAKPDIIPFLEEKDPYLGRLIGPSLKRRRHVITQFCSPEGKAERKIYTKGKHSPFYKDIRKESEWGDLIKLTPPDSLSQESSDTTLL